MAATLTARVRRRLLDVDLSLDLAASPVTVLFGPSGAGKTTLLRCIAGLERPEAGSRVALGDQVWSDAGTWVPARHRRIGYLFQDHVLFPHLSVAKNVGYGLRHVPRAQRDSRIHTVLTQVGAQHLAPRNVRDLSGGEAQRVALARALAPEPQLLLLDEPLSSLDGPTRSRLRGEIRGLLLASGVPALIVTHDRAEALSLGDNVAVILDGRLRQLDPVDTVFSRPVDEQVAAAVDTETIVVGHTVTTAAGVTAVMTRGVTLYAVHPQPLAAGTEVLACVRAEDVALYHPDNATHAKDGSPRNQLSATVTTLTDQGPLIRVDLDAGFPLAAYITRPTRDDLDLTPGTPIQAVIKATSVHLVARPAPSA